MDGDTSWQQRPTVSPPINRYGGWGQIGKSRGRSNAEGCACPIRRPDTVKRISTCRHVRNREGCTPCSITLDGYRIRGCLCYLHLVNPDLDLLTRCIAATTCGRARPN